MNAHNEQQPAAQEAVAWFTDDHLTDKSATTYDAAVAERWRAKGWPVTPLYAAPVTAAPEWQPMETAPRDGTVVLVAIGGSDIPQPCRFRDRVGWVIEWDEWRIPAHDGPLGWMPLPATAHPQGVK